MAKKKGSKVKINISPDGLLKSVRKRNNRLSNAAAPITGKKKKK